ncbi:MAG: methionyl-tRNA formyltransferase, partial [Parvicella sp.]
MGTPDFAVASLDLINKSNHEIVGVITATDKPAGRGQKLRGSAVKEYAVENQLNLLQPSNLKDPEFISELASLNAELFIVVAFRMLPAVVFEMPPKGTINLHGSLLPQYRGAAPINWAIINGETETGASTFFIEQKIDTGEIIDNVKVTIGPNTTAGELHDALMHSGSTLLLDTVNSIENGTNSSTPQDNSKELKKAFKIFKDTCKINWELEIQSIHNLIRGLSPYPASWTDITIDGQELTAKVFKSEIADLETESKTGSYTDH